jgi:hypothetical protein
MQSGFEWPISLPLTLAIISAIAGAIVVLLVGGDQIRAYLERRRISKYKPAIEDVWAEGTVLYGASPSGGTIGPIDPYVYLSFRLTPKHTPIRACDAELSCGWFAFFDGPGRFQNDLTHALNLHVGRFHVNLATGTLEFERPVYLNTVQAMGGWAGQPAPPPVPPVKVTVRGEVAGANREWVLDLGLDPSVLLQRIRWQDDHPAQILAAGKKVIDAWLLKKATGISPANASSPTGKP